MSSNYTQQIRSKIISTSQYKLTQSTSYKNETATNITFFCWVFFTVATYLDSCVVAKVLAKVFLYPTNTFTCIQTHTYIYVMFVFVFTIFTHIIYFVLFSLYYPPFFPFSTTFYAAYRLTEKILIKCYICLFYSTISEPKLFTLCYC